MKEIIIHKALNTEETPMGPVPSRRKTRTHRRLIDHFIAGCQRSADLTTAVSDRSARRDEAVNGIVGFR